MGNISENRRTTGDKGGGTEFVISLTLACACNTISVFCLFVCLFPEYKLHWSTSHTNLTFCIVWLCVFVFLCNNNEGRGAVHITQQYAIAPGNEVDAQMRNISDLLFGSVSKLDLQMNDKGETWERLDGGELIMREISAADI